MKIKTKDGSVIDLAILRANLDGGVPWASAILDALEAALSVPDRYPHPDGVDDDEDAPYRENICTGHRIALESVWEAVGVVNDKGEPRLPGEPA